MRFLLALCASSLALLVAQPRQPDTGAQKAAMKKLEFLVGEWEGDSRVWRGPGEALAIRQSERIQMKLDGLVLLVEGTGRDPKSGQVSFQAMATIAYDDAAQVYRFRSFNDGRYLETELTVSERGFAWGFDVGPAKVRYAMALNEKGEWTESGEVTVGASPPRKTVEMTLRRVK